MMNPLPIVIGALSGVILGSFLATLVIRWPTIHSAVTGRSRCDHCGISFSVGKLMPLISYILQRGRARCCGRLINPLHPGAQAFSTIIGGMSFGLLLGWMAECAVRMVVACPRSASGLCGVSGSSVSRYRRGRGHLCAGRAYRAGKQATWVRRTWEDILGPTRCRSCRSRAPRVWPCLSGLRRRFSKSWSRRP